jgi:ribonuclease R
MNFNPTAELGSSRTYDNPIPGRDFILGLFGKMRKNLNREQIARKLDLTNPEQKEALRRRLRAMERDGQLSFNQSKGYQLIAKELLVDGVISIHPDGFGFVSYSKTEKDLFLPKGQLSHVFDGDVVQVLLESIGSKRSKLIKIVERRTTHIAGLLQKQGKDYVVVPDCNKLSHNIQVDALQLLNAKVGELVNTQITSYPTFRHDTQVQITEVLGHPNAPGMETKLALRRHDIAEQWSESLLAQAELLGSQVSEQDKIARVDYRDLPFVTIDGADAKDFDDAVYCELTEQGDWRLLVGIADVSHYVQPDDELDIEAQERATSIYCPGQVIPMLPEALSNGLCSLKPNEDRLAMVCEMTINSSGIVTQSKFNEGLIHSHARLTYDQAHAIIAKPRSKVARNIHELLPDIAPHIKNLHALYTNLSGARKQRSAIEFETNEMKLNLNKKLKIASFEPIKRHDAHRMIEEFMLCANVATAKFLERYKISGLFRIHQGPQQKKLTHLRATLAEKGLKLGGGDKPSTQDYNDLLAKISHRSDANVIRTLLLRSQSQAEYSPDNQGHFGLAYDAYAHFTSPIRRYPDLVTHRAIRAKIRSTQQSGVHQVLSFLGLDKLSGKVLSKKSYPYNYKAIKQLSEHCSAQSRQADEVSREVESALKCQYMQKFIGESFAAKISGVTSFGLFVELSDNGVEGLVPLTSFSQAGFAFDASKQQLANGKQCFSLGDSVSVILNAVDTRQRKMEFSLTKVNASAAA